MEQTGGEFRTGLLSPDGLVYMEVPLSEALKVWEDPDIHRRFDYVDYNALPIHITRNWGVYKNGEIIALLTKVNLYHFYVVSDKRHLADMCFEIFERHHPYMKFKVDRRFKDAIIFAMKHGYREVSGVFEKCHL